MPIRKNRSDLYDDRCDSLLWENSACYKAIQGYFQHKARTSIWYKAPKSNEEQQKATNGKWKHAAKTKANNKKQQRAFFIPIFIHSHQFGTFRRWLISRTIKSRKEQRRATKSNGKQQKAAKSNKKEQRTSKLEKPKRARKNQNEQRKAQEVQMKTRFNSFHFLVTLWSIFVAKNKITCSVYLLMTSL